MKVTKIIKGEEPIRGYTLKNGEIGVNIERLYLESKSEKDFIHKFSRTLQHEILHREITNVLPEHKYFYGEEVVVRLLTNEPFMKGEREYYKNDG